jgi:hypothetical protein
MLTEDQSGVIAFLASPAAHGGTPVERIDTHASIVFLAGDRALKLKRAVRYDYLDFSTAERRRRMCEAELKINRRTAPAIYRRVVPVTREDDASLAIDGRGTPVDWLVEMVRFDQDLLLDRLAGRGALDIAAMRPLAAGIAQFHRAAEERRDHGGVPGMRWVVDGNALGFAEQGTGILDPARCAALTADTHHAIDRHAALLDDRREAGFVRQCHGDLHLRNIVLLDGRPTLFDAIEFNDEIACTDTLYDLAFLLMDLWRRELPRHANAVWNGYLSDTGDTGGMPVLPLFLSCRAAVRAKTSATAATLEADVARRRALAALAQDYLAMAWQLLHPPPPCLIAVGGLSGSGKSALAIGLAPFIGAAPGAVVIRSDEVRKELSGVDALVRLGADAYTAERSRRVYATVNERADTIVRSGHAAIADAVFSREADREAIERTAAAAGVPFVGFWLDAPRSVLVTRVEGRGLDASDADAGVVDHQLREETGPIRWHRIDASADAAAVLERALARSRASARAGQSTDS